MDNKKGIRLRYLEIQKGQCKQEKNQRNNKVQKREPSPINRKKIFDQIDTYIPEQNQKPLKVYSPIKNKPIMTSYENSFSEIQFQNLVKSLKEKSIQLEKRNQIIRKIKRENQNLRIQNQKYKIQICSLKKQLQNKNNSRPISHESYQKSNHQNYQLKNHQDYLRNYNYQQKNHLNFARNQNYQQIYHQDYPKNQNYDNENKKYRNQNQFKLNNQAYEEFVEEKSTLKYNYEGQGQRRQPRKIFIEGSRHHQQDVKDIVSPLMALNSPPLPQFNQRSSFQKRKRQSTFSAKVIQNFEPEQHSNNKSYNHGHYYQNNFKKEQQNFSNFERPKSKVKELQIEDSKQFKFEDFQFSDYDSFSKNDQKF